LSEAYSSELAPSDYHLFGPLNEHLCGESFRYNEEILILKKYILRFIKSHRLRWAAHVVRMDTTRIVKKITEWEPCSSRPVGRPRQRWLDQVEEDLKKMKVRNSREKCKDRRLWNEIVKQAKTHQGVFLSWLRSVHTPTRQVDMLP
jgi:ribonuclease HI